MLKSLSRLLHVLGLGLLVLGIVVIGPLAHASVGRPMAALGFMLLLVGRLLPGFPGARRSSFRWMLPGVVGFVLCASAASLSVAGIRVPADMEDAAWVVGIALVCASILINLVSIVRGREW